MNSNCRTAANGVCKRIAGIVLAATAALAAVPAFAEMQLNMTRGVTDISDKVYYMHMLAFWIMCIVAFGVFGAMFWSIVRHRKSKGRTPSTFHESIDRKSVV